MRPEAVSNEVQFRRIEPLLPQERTEFLANHKRILGRLDEVRITRQVRPIHQQNVRRGREVAKGSPHLELPRVRIGHVYRGIPSMGHDIGLCRRIDCSLVPEINLAYIVLTQEVTEVDTQSIEDELVLGGVNRVFLGSGVRIVLVVLLACIVQFIHRHGETVEQMFSLGSS